MLAASALHTCSTRKHPLGDAATRILAAALSAVDPRRVITDAVRVDEGRLFVGDRSFDLAPEGRILVAGAGKAGLGMVLSLVDVLGERINDGVVVIKASAGTPVRTVGRVRILPSAHPIVDERSISAGRALLDLVAGAGPDDVVLCPISGGASALIAVPTEGIDLAALQQTTRELLRAGVDIGQLNAVRKHLDRVKGGGLARAAAPARVVSLVLSDVVGDRIDVIGSGPTADDPSTFGDAMQVLRNAGVDVVPAVQRVLAAGMRGDLDEGAPLDDARVTNIVLAGNDTAVQAARAQATRENLRVVDTHPLQGEARICGQTLARRTSELAGDGPGCIIAGGETTVTVVGNGMGGRNLEVALGAIEPLAAHTGSLLMTLATDGEDGPTDAAGAVVTADTANRAKTLGLSTKQAAANNDTLPLFDALEDTIRTGPTGTNACDLALLLRT